MFEFNYALKLIDNFIQFLFREKKTGIFHTEWVLPRSALEFFEIHFETVYTFSKIDLGHSISCRYFESLMKSLKSSSAAAN